MSAKIRIAQELLSKPIVRVAQEAPAAAPAEPAAKSPAPAPAPAAAPAQPGQPAPAQPGPQASENWVKLENIIKELQAYHSNQSQYGDRIAIQVSDDAKSKKFNITIKKSEMVKPGNEGVQ